MNLIQPSFDIWEQPTCKVDALKQIERAARVCYKSEDKTTEDSYKAMYKRLYESGHTSCLEHGTAYLAIPEGENEDLVWLLMENIYTRYGGIGNLIGSKKYYFFTTNMRVIEQNELDVASKYFVAPTIAHEDRVSVKFTCDCGVAREFTRHRVFSFAQESTRYCNYTKDKFGNELTFVEPLWMLGYDCESESKEQFVRTLEQAEQGYNWMIAHGFQAQQARDVLPLCTKTELVMTGFVSDWKAFFELRADGKFGAPHPAAKDLAEPLKERFKLLGYL